MVRWLINKMPWLSIAGFSGLQMQYDATHVSPAANHEAITSNTKENSVALLA
jgi:hypothetical protein